MLRMRVHATRSLWSTTCIKNISRVHASKVRNHNTTTFRRNDSSCSNISRKMSTICRSASRGNGSSSFAIQPSGRIRRKIISTFILGQTLYYVTCYQNDSDISSTKLEQMAVVSQEKTEDNDSDDSIILTYKAKEQRWLLLFSPRWMIERIWDALRVAIRFTEMSVRFSPCIILFPISSDLGWSYTRYTLQKLGPVFVKLAQWASTRRDLFSRTFCDQLAPLQHFAYNLDRKNKKTDAYIQCLLEEAFGPDYNNVLELQDCIGSGCIASVYRGIYHPNNKSVAIKILHPHIQQHMERDIHLLRCVASLVHELCPLLHLPRAIDNFSQHLKSQIDLSKEGSNLLQFHRNFDSSETVHFPRPLYYQSTNVLIEEYIPFAKSIAEYYHHENLTNDNSVKTTSDKKYHSNNTKEMLAKSLCGAFFKMIFIDNFVHCDLHPGNIMVVQETTTKDKGSNGQSSFVVEDPKIVFLDTGMAHSLNSNDLKNLRDLFKAVVVNDGETAGKLMMERAKYIQPNFAKKESFAKSIGAIVNEFHEKKSLTFGAIQVGVLLSRVLNQCRIHGVEIDPAMSTIVLSTLVLEGVGRSLNPDLNLMDAAMPFILGMGRI